MPRFVYELPELENSVTRPVLMDVIHELMRKMGINETETLIQFPGGNSQIAQAGSTLDQTDDKARLAFDNRFIISVEEDYPEETGMTQVLQRPENVVFFSDKDLEIYMKPVYNLTTYNISIKFRARTKTEADRWKERVFRLIGKTRIGFDHVCTYQYPIPPTFFAILCEIHKLRENISPYNELAKDWIKRCMSDNFTVITNQAAKASTMVIRETQIGAVGQLDFGGNPPKPEKEESSGVWEASFEYVFNFYKPVSAAMQFPCIVHNQIMPQKWLEKSNFPVSPLDYKRYGSLTTQYLAKLFNPNFLLEAANQGVAFQEYDDWFPEYQPPFTKMMFRTLIQIDLNDPCLILDLKELPGYILDKDAVAYMKLDPSSLMSPGDNVFRITLYERYNPVRDILIDMNSDLIVRGFQPMSVRKNYHLVLSVTYDLQGLNPRAKENLRKSGAFFYKLLDLISPNFRRRRHPTPYLTSTGAVPLREFNELLHGITLKRAAGAPLAAGNTLSARVGQFVIANSRTQ